MQLFPTAKITILVLSLILMTACQPATEAEVSKSMAPLSVNKAWVRNMPPGRMMTAAYAELTNTSDAPITLSSFNSPAFSSVSLHETITDKQGMSKMQEIEELVLQPGETVVLQPGGKHIMLMGMKNKQLNDGSGHISISFGPDLVRDVVFEIK